MLHQQEHQHFRTVFFQPFSRQILKLQITNLLQYCNLIFKLQKYLKYLSLPVNIKRKKSSNIFHHLFHPLFSLFYMANQDTLDTFCLS